MNGIDVSQWQGYIDFDAVKRAGIGLVYIKASEGTNFVDPFFYRNYANAKNAGISVGFYHYLTARSVAQARQEAYHFVSVTEGLANDGKLVMDMEDIEGLGREEINEIARMFLESVEEFSGRSGAIYADAYTAAELLTEDLAVYPLWIAQYDVEEPALGGAWETWAGWQYTDMDRVAGIQGNVDRDIFTEEMLEEEKRQIQRQGERPADGNEVHDYRIYRIQNGDTLYAIAGRYGTTVDALVKENGIKNPSLIYAGQLLKLPGDS